MDDMDELNAAVRRLKEENERITVLWHDDVYEAKEQNKRLREALQKACDEFRSRGLEVPVQWTEVLE